MLRTLFALPALLLLVGASLPALAQGQPQSLDQRVSQAREAMFRAQAEFYLLVGQQLQERLTEAAKREAEKDRWWGSYVKGLKPDGK